MINNIISLFKRVRKTNNSFSKRYMTIIIVSILSLLIVIFYKSNFTKFEVEVTQAIAFPLSSEDMNETNFSFEKKENYYFKQVAGLNLTLFQYK